MQSTGRKTALNIECFKDVTMEKIDWLWPHRLPIGKISMLVGDPGLGKSFLSLDIAARVSSGRTWPDNQGTPANRGDVLLITGEDDPADTIKPRLMAAGADMDHVYVLKGLTVKWEDGKEERKDFNLQSGLIALDTYKEQIPNLSLIILDPITAYMGDIDSHANADVRSVLDRVSEWASRNKVAILAISHLNKNTMMSAKHRVMGSMAFVAVARIVWNVVEDPEDSKRRLFLLSKTNIVEDIGGLAFKLKSVKVGGEEEIETAVCDFESKTLEESANELLESTVENLEHTKNKAIKWLKNVLKDGPLMVKDIMTVAKEDGISETALSRAKKVLQIRVKKIGVDGGWEWEL